MPAVISAVVLPRMLPHTAHRLMLTGEVFDGATAAAGGLVDLCVPDDEVDTAVAAQVTALAAGAPAALAETKRLLRAARTGPWTTEQFVEDVAALLRTFDEPAVLMWHVNNEYGCHVSACYCDASAAAFRTWLQARYGDLDRLVELRLGGGPAGFGIATENDAPMAAKAHVLAKAFLAAHTRR